MIDEQARKHRFLTAFGMTTRDNEVTPSIRRSGMKAVFQEFNEEDEKTKAGTRCLRCIGSEQLDHRGKSEPRVLMRET